MPLGRSGAPGLLFQEGTVVEVELLVMYLYFYLKMLKRFKIQRQEGSTVKSPPCSFVPQPL